MDLAGCWLAQLIEDPKLELLVVDRWWWVLWLLLLKGAGGLWYVYAYMIYMYISIFMLQTFHICMYKWLIYPTHFNAHFAWSFWCHLDVWNRSTCCARNPPCWYQLTYLLELAPRAPWNWDGMELRWANFTYQVGVFISRWALRGGFPWWVNDVARFWFCIQKCWVIPKGVYLMLFEHNIELHITRYSYRA